MQIVAVAKCLRKSILGDLGNLFFSAQGKHAAYQGVLFCFLYRVPGIEIYPPDKNCVSYASHKIVWKLAYLDVKMMSFDQKHKPVIKVANLGVTKLCTSFKGIKSS